MMKFTDELHDLFPLLQSARSELTIEECDTAKSIGVLFSLHVFHLHLFCIAPHLAQESFRLLHRGETSMALRADLCALYASQSALQTQNLKQPSADKSASDDSTSLPQEIDLRTHHFMSSSVLDDCVGIIEHELAQRGPSVPFK